VKPILEKIDVSSNEGIHAFIFEGTHFDMPWHFHPEYELTLILKSSGIRHVGNNISDFEPGDLVLLGGNLPHCWKNENSHTGTSRSLVIQWEKNIIHNLPLLEPINNLLTKADRGLKLNENIYTEEIKLMHHIVETNGIKRYLALIELLYAIVAKNEYVFVAGSSYSYDLSTTTTTRLEKVQTFVNKHFQEKIKLKEIAEHLHMNEQAFSRFFSKTMKKPFFLFLNEYRVNRASRLIFETDLHMSEIAYECGYESLPFFYKQFKKFKGYTPLEFRKMYKKVR